MERWELRYGMHFSDASGGLVVVVWMTTPSDLHVSVRMRVRTDR